jgi:hypothetical protein
MWEVRFTVCSYWQAVKGHFPHTRRVLSSTFVSSHQEPVSGQACNPPDPKDLFLLLFGGRN